MTWTASLSDDRMQLNVTLADGALSLSAADVDAAIRLLLQQRALMLPLPAETAPHPPREDYWVTNLTVRGNPKGQRIGLHIRCLELGWIMYSIPASMHEHLIADIRTAAAATTVLVLPMAPGTTAQ